jgi:hypothetical protein
MTLDLTEEEAAALLRELDEIIETDRYPFFAPHPHPQGDPRQAQTGAGSRALAAAEGVCAAIERPIPATRLDEAST